ncbi:MAG: fasciclin domain-containing protein [Planctomycetota bacterium]
MPSALMFACAFAFGASEPPSIVEIASGNDNFETLTAALAAAELVDDIDAATGITVLAPTDAAFGKLDQRALENTIEMDPTGRLADVLRYHVIPERLTAAELASRRFVTTLDGQRLEIGTGRGLTIGGSTVRAADIEASNGIIHAIDAVLLPAKDDVPVTAATAGSFSTLIQAATQAGLLGVLSQNDPITVFAPTDEAFAELGDATIENLLRPESRSRLVEILSYHVVIGERLYAEDLLGGSAFETASGASAEASTRDAMVFVNESRVVAANIDTSNGVIHVIDRVLIPAETTASSPAETVVSPASAADVLQLAIERGVPLFNDGQQAACADVYEVAIAAVLGLDDGLPAGVRTPLAEALEESRHVHSQSRRAWVLRGGMDRALAALRHSQARMMRDSGGPSA